MQHAGAPLALILVAATVLSATAFVCPAQDAAYWSQNQSQRVIAHQWAHCGQWAYGTPGQWVGSKADYGTFDFDYTITTYDTWFSLVLYDYWTGRYENVFYCLQTDL